MQPEAAFLLVRCLVKAAPAATTSAEVIDMEEEEVPETPSDQGEWEAIVKMGAAKVHQGSAAQTIRDRYPSRIITSRMIRRKKPMPGVGAFKYKSRWCVHGHRDPDGHTLVTYSPMPSVESITMFFQVCLNLRLEVSFADVTNAFCQADELKRPAGPLFIKPCM